MTGDEIASVLVLRFGAARFCLWTLCGHRACRRARACRGDPRRCMGLLREWLGAVDEESRVRGSFAPLEPEIKTLAEARAYLAWHKARARAATGAQSDPESMDARAADRLRYDLARRLEALHKAHGQEES